ncbi:MAG TPA: hypothetical protein DCE56_29250 [Cyanobacteria bacterium UBA8553]|nr:hypothetical protein [Cyanobacteria bacterium UBA8553]HAJ63138.1 hypothetical protein [Cyanobacteria bacterium UBA8543]
MQWRFKSTGLFFSHLLLLVFIASCQNASNSPTDSPTPADTPAGTSSTPADTPLPTPTLLPKINIDKIVQDAIDQLSVGKILFNVPEEMQVGETERIEVRIAKTVTKDFDNKLKGKGKPVLENIKFGTVTEVKLEGNSFEIKGISTGLQVVGGEDYTEWSWDVTPKKSGEQTLSLIVSVRIKVPQLEIDSVRNYPVDIKKIKVKVNPIYSIKDLLINNWSDLFPLIFGSGSIAGIIGWIIAKRKKFKKSNSKPTDNQEDVDNQEANDER